MENYDEDFDLEKRGKRSDSFNRYLTMSKESIGQVSSVYEVIFVLKMD